MPLKARPTVDDLFQFEGKAELVNGRIVHMPPSGAMPGYAADEIRASLRDYARATGRGRSVGGTQVFRVDLPRRESFSPDAAYYAGRSPRTMKYYAGPPAFAAEVRDADDYGPAAEAGMADKRADYFAAGTLVVWDVDLLHDDVVRVYRPSDPQIPKVYRRGDAAEAEPAVPGWTMPVDNLFEPG